MSRSHAAIFAPHYRLKSGPGSKPEFTEPYRKFLEDFISQREIESVLDLGCGDLEIMSRVNLHGATYLGIDVIAARVAANASKHPELPCVWHDLTTYQLPPADLIICKDVIQHWTNDEVLTFIERLEAAPFRYALITNCNYGPANHDIKTGGWRPIDLTAPPFCVGESVFRWGTKQTGGEKEVVLIRGPEPFDGEF